MDTQIDQIINAQSETSLWIPCRDERHACSIKVQAWRRLKKYKEKTGINPNVITSIRKRDQDEVFVVLTKQLFPSGTFMLSKDGVKTLLKDSTIDPDKERMIHLMVEDGLSKEAILSHFDELNEEELHLLSSLIN
jgi:hypothetical protein